ncbi:MAG: class I SAM-dependent methyltransferase [Phycisphaerales bacterium]
MCQSCSCAANGAAAVMDAASGGAAAMPAFVQSMLDMLNHAGLAMMISIGHRTGLFDTMTRGVCCETGAPAAWNSEELAKAAGLSERYVREWLGAMVTGRIVTLGTDGRYTLPKEHAAWLTRAAEPNNIAVTAQWVGLLGKVEDEVVAAFTHGRGVPYSSYGKRFHDVMADENRQTAVLALDSAIVPLVEGLHERLERGISVLDIACGKGLGMLHLAKRYPRSRFTGVDFSAEAITMGRDEARAAGVRNLELIVGDVTSFGSSGVYDLVTGFDAIHDQAKPAAVLANIRRLLAPGGVFLMQDIKARTAHADNLDHPMGPFLYTISTMHCMSVSLANGGPGLGAAWGREKALEMLGEAGFGNVGVNELDHDLINYYYVCRRDAA